MSDINTEAERNRAGRKTNEERRQREQEEKKAERYAAQEAKRAELYQIDTRAVLLAWIIGVGIAFTTSAVISFNGITSVAPLVGLAFAWMAGLFFFFIEFMYVLFLVAYLALDSRNEDTRAVQGGMWFFAGVAILANAFHTLNYHQWELNSPETWAGVVLSIAAPITILSISKVASRLVFAKAIKLEQ